VLAVAGLVFAVAGVVAFVIVEAPGWVLGLFALVAVTAVVDIVVVARRKQRGESG
jgi:polynucleotide 5'-kinase involved in rRNA processing